MKTILMIGTLPTPQTSELCASHGIQVMSADNAQRYILHGIELCNDIRSIDVIGAVRIPCYPHTSVKKIVQDKDVSLKGTVTSIGFNNYPIVGFWERERNIIKEARLWAKAHRGQKDIIVFIYSMHSPFMKAAKAIKKIIPSVEIVQIVPDLPLMMNIRGNLKAVLKQIDWKQIQGLMKYIDKYLLYTKHMAEYLNLPDDSWMVFEGLMDEKKIVNTVPKKKNNLCIYAGNLEAKYGLNMLMEAFNKTRSDAKLHIYGGGEDAVKIAETAKAMTNVVYKGKVSPDEAFELMKRASLLINPRPTTLELSRFSCPSKTFEYMASGTPTLMSHLPGLPDEYSPYLFFVEDESAEGYSKKIDEFFELPPEKRREFGLRAANFLKEAKNSRVVMEKVFNFIQLSYKTI